MLMTKDEVKEASQVWAANVEAPLTRDEQIKFIVSVLARRNLRGQNESYS